MPALVLQDRDVRCNACGEAFDSRTKLFAHVSKTGHERAVPDAVKAATSAPSAKGKGKSAQGKR
jgi:DnaJ family protein A protein 5